MKSSYCDFTHRTMLRIEQIITRHGSFPGRDLDRRRLQTVIIRGFIDPTPSALHHPPNSGCAGEFYKTALHKKSAQGVPLHHDPVPPENL